VYDRSKDEARYEKACLIYDVEQTLSDQQLNEHRRILHKISPEEVTVDHKKKSQKRAEKDEMKAIQREMKNKLDEETAFLHQKLEDQQTTINEIKKLLLELKERR
jgi:cell division septum initiation protein DivIVA